MSRSRVDDLRAQARFARQRYDLYKAKTYGDRPTSPARLRQLERISARAAEAFRFARAEASRAAAKKAAAAPPRTPSSGSDAK